MKDLRDLKRLERDDLRRLERQVARERRALRQRERQERRRELWPRWVAFWESVAKHLKTAGLVVAGAAGVVSGVIGLWNGIGKARALWSAREVGTVLPPPTGAQTTAMDFVTKHPPDGGNTR